MVWSFCFNSAAISATVKIFVWHGLNLIESNGRRSSLGPAGLDYANIRSSCPSSSTPSPSTTPRSPGLSEAAGTAP